MRVSGIGVEVNTAAESYRAPVAVVTAGPWAGQLLRDAGIDLPLVPSFEQVTYFALEDPSPLPTIIDWSVTPPNTPYVVPNPEEPGHFKVALHMSGPPVDANERSFEPDPEPRTARHRVRGHALRPASSRARDRHVPVHEHARRGLRARSSGPGGDRVAVQRSRLQVRAVRRPRPGRPGDGAPDAVPDGALPVSCPRACARRRPAPAISSDRARPA